MIRKAMILAAGLGTRLRPLTYHLPKPLVPVGLRSMIAHHLDQLAQLGIQEVMINTHHLAERIPQTLGDGAAWGLQLHYSHESPDILGTGGGLAQVRAFFEQEDAFLLLNGDILHNLDLHALAKAHVEAHAAVTLALRSHPGDPAMGWIGTNEALRVWRVPDMETVHPLQKQMFTGLSILTPSVFSHLPAQGYSCILRSGVRGLLEQGAHIQGHLDDHSVWADIGTPFHYLQANLDALVDPRFPHPTDALIHQGTQGPFWLSAHHQADLKTLTGGYALIGEQASIGSHCHLERVVVWPHARIPPHARYLDGIAYLDQFLSLPSDALRAPKPLHPTP